MIIKVEDIPQEGLNIDFHKQEKWWKLEKEKDFLGVDLATPLTANIKLTPMQEKVHVTGEIHGKLKLFCARCLEQFDYPLEIKINFMLVPKWQAPRSEIFRLKKDDMEIEFFDGVEVDIDQVVSEQIFLNIPIKPLCRPDCAGLCPYCGINLNKGKCQCKRPKYSPFYEALKHLKKKHNS
ncbi:MAG: DUF177 domain-containing protein [Candidatus Desulfofervidaceae bacterium]|nr:DUF177 domain-containing protein [Candidatus Desulfofervidaceae bacterium]